MKHPYRNNRGNEIINYFTLSLFLVLISAGCKMSDSSDPQNNEKSANFATQKNDFDFDTWKQKYCLKTDIKTWQKQNPGPWRSYLNAGSVACAKKWYINLGPLGVMTNMHDISWDEKAGFKENYPKALTDSLGLVKNNFEVLAVKPGSPAENHLKKGDLILQIDGVDLKPAQELDLSEKVSRLSVRSLEYQAGLLIDKAEGRGKIQLTVLRLPENIKFTYPKRNWTTIISQKLIKPFKIDIPVKNGMLYRFETGWSARERNWWQVKGNLKLVNSNEKTKTISLSDGIFRIPKKGKWKLVGEITQKRRERKLCSLQVAPQPQLPTEFKKYITKVEFDIPKLGSFGETYSPTSQKAVNMAKVMTTALAAQQQPDGSWANVYTYASPAFYTSMAGLALMSTGDPAYNEQIKKAAYYVAYGESMPKKWSYPRGTNLIFLSEYYLRTKDEGIVPGLKAKISASIACVFADYTAGHGVSSPGYGGGGYIGSGSVICCGLAVADKCGLLNNNQQATLDKMLERAQELAPHGKIPYGRVGRRNTEMAGGQSGGCGTGAYLSAALIRGGARNFVDVTSTRYSTSPFGDAEGGHATQTLHFFWSSLASFNSSLKAHIENMSAYIWKFVTYREFDGLANHNNSSLEYHNGDGVIGDPFWRTSSFIILLNAHKRNLAITGDPKYINTVIKENEFVFSGDRSAHNYILRNWHMAEQLMGKNKPALFNEVLDKIIHLPQNKKLGVNLLQLLTDNLAVVTQTIDQLPDLDTKTKNLIARLINGITFQAEIALAPQAKKQTKEEKKAFEKVLKEGKINYPLNYIVKITPLSFINKFGLRVGAKENIYRFMEAAGTFTIEDPEGKVLLKPITFSFNTELPIPQSGREQSAQKKLIVKQFNLSLNPKEKRYFIVKFDYKIAGNKFQYSEKFPFPTKKSRAYVPNLCEVWLPGTVVSNYKRQYVMRIMLNNGRILGCEKRRSISESFVLAGTPCEFLISPDSTWSHRIVDVKIIDPKFRSAGTPEIAIAGLKAKGIPTVLVDYNNESAIKIAKTQKTFTIIETFKKPVTVDSFTAIFDSTAKSWSRSFSCTLEVKVEGKWQLLFQGGMPYSNIREFPTVKAKEFKFTINTVDLGNWKLQELRLNKALSPEMQTKFNKLTW